jgi:hypothetical protein
MYGHDNMESRIRTHLKRGSLPFQLCMIEQWYKWTIKEEDTNPTAKSNGPQNILRSSLLHLY